MMQRFVDLETLVESGRAQWQPVPQYGANVYDDPIGVATIEDAWVTRIGVYLPDEKKWVRETHIAGYLKHRQDIDKVIPLQNVSLPEAYQPDTVEDADFDVVWARFPWDKNYQHFFIETMPRIFMHRALARFTNRPTRYYVHAAGFIPEFCQLLGLAPWEIAAADFNSTEHETALRCARVSVPSVVNVNMLRITNAVLAGAVDALRSAARAAPGEAHRQSVFISRRGDAGTTGSGRVMLNAADLEHSLAMSGVETVFMEGLNIPEKITLLSHVRRVVTPVGAGLINLAFAPVLREVLILQHPQVNLPTKWFAQYLNHFRDVKVTELMCELDTAAVADRHAPFFCPIDQVQNWVNVRERA